MQTLPISSYSSKRKPNFMGSNESAKHKELTEKIREQKQGPKGPIKFQLQLNDEQKVAKDKILGNAITVLSG